MQTLTNRDNASSKPAQLALPQQHQQYTRIISHFSVLSQPLTLIVVTRAGQEGCHGS